MRYTQIAAPCLAAWLTACSAGQAQQVAVDPLDLSGTIALRDAGDCRFDPLTEHAFEGLLLIGWEPDSVTSAPVIALGEARFAPQFERTQMVGVPDGYEYGAHVEPAEGSTWHGLPLRRLWAEFLAPPETDSLYRRGMTFRSERRASAREACGAGGRGAAFAEFSRT